MTTNFITAAGVAEEIHNNTIRLSKTHLYQTINNFILEHNLSVFLIFLLTLSLLMIASKLVRKYYLSGRKKRSVVSDTSFKTWAWATLIFGIVVHFIGMSYRGTGESLIALSIRSFIGSLTMFLGSTTYSELSSEFTDSALLMTLFAFARISALLVTATFVISSLSQRLVSSSRMFWWRVKALVSVGKSGDVKHHSGIFGFFSSPRQLYVFFGVNEESMTLARSIGADNQIIMVEMPASGDECSRSMSLSRVFGIHQYSGMALQAIEELNCVIKNVDVNLAKITSDDNSRILDTIGLSSLYSLMRRSEKVHVFFLSDNEADNIKSVINVVEDKELLDLGDRLMVYCHARQNDKNFALLGENPVNTEIVDSDYLAVMALKMQTKDAPNGRTDVYVNHPVNFVDIDPLNATVNSTFTAMIIGFGKTGQETLKFIFEFSAFLHGKKDKSAFKCYCVDNKIDKMQAQFTLDVPYAKEMIAQGELEFLDVNQKSSQFWSFMAEKINDINYVVVALNDDDNALDITTKIYNFANRYRVGGFDKFHIFVRMFRDENKRNLFTAMSTMNSVAMFDEASANAEGKPEGKRACEEVVTAFGCFTEIFRKDIVIEGVIDSVASRFSATYNKLYPYKGEDFLQKKERRNYLVKQSSRRKKLQNFSNALHIYSKAMLIGGYDRLKSLVKKNSDGFYVISDEHLRHNLSRTEHFRWNASHYMLGYLLMPDDMKQIMALQGKTVNEQMKQHCCLVEFDELSDILQIFDTQVVDATSALVMGYDPANVIG